MKLKTNKKSIGGFAFIPLILITIFVLIVAAVVIALIIEAIVIWNAKRPIHKYSGEIHVAQFDDLASLNARFTNWVFEGDTYPDIPSSRFGQGNLFGGPDEISGFTIYYWVDVTQVTNQWGVENKTNAWLAVDESPLGRLFSQSSTSNSVTLGFLGATYNLLIGDDTNTTSLHVGMGQDDQLTTNSSGNTATLTIPVDIYMFYVYRTTNLVDWELIWTNSAGVGISQSYTDTNILERAFYRVAATNTVFLPQE
jgi:hypothetical protein